MSQTTTFEYDPNTYDNGNNGLSVGEATGRVFSKAMGTLGRGAGMDDGGRGFSRDERMDVYDAVCDALGEGASRADLYRSAGDVVVDARGGNVVPGRSLAAEFARRVRGAYGSAVPA